MSTSSPTRPAAPRGRRRWLWVGLGLALPVGLLLGAPAVLAPLLERRLTTELATRFEGSASVGKLELAYPCELRLDELRVVGADSAPLFALKRARVSFDVLGYLRGAGNLELESEGATLHLWRNAEGDWSLGRDSGGPATPSSSDAPDTPPGPPSAAPSLPPLRFSVTGQDVVAVLHGADSDAWNGAELRLDFRLHGETERLDLQLESLVLDSEFVRGQLNGELTNGAASLAGEGAAVGRARLDGELHYVPATLGTLLSTELPLQFTGQAQEHATVHFEGPLQGPLSELDPMRLLAAGAGSMHVGLGTLLTPMLDAGGDVELSLTDGRADLQGEWRANGGRLSLTGSAPLGRAPLEAQAALLLHLEAEGVGADARLAPLLASLHPAFLTLEALEGTGLAGRIDAGLDLTLAGELDPTNLMGTDGTFPVERLSGRGRFELRDAAFASSPVLDEMLGLLGLETSERFTLRPLEFTVKEGRVSYDRPWTWTISGAETTFQGTVGLDRSLDLVWNVPITPDLIAKHSFLQYAAERELRIPITGSATHPRIEWRSLLTDLAATTGRKVLTSGLEEELRDRLGLGQAAGKGDVDPAALLAEADRLWDAGKQAEAAPIYARIRKEFKVSLVYALHRDRIKRREKSDG